MKKASLMFVLAGLLMTSCLKDGFNDFEGLKHPMYLEGEVSPAFGIPIGTGSTTIHDLLNMFQETESYVTVDENGIITISYDTSMTYYIDIEDSAASEKKKAFSKVDTEIVHVSHTSFNGSYSIDLFNNISFLENAEIEVDNLIVDLNTFVSSNSDGDAQAKFEDFHVHVYFNDLFIDVIGQDGVLHHVYSHPGNVSIDSILAGQYIYLFDHVDISEAINSRPKEIRYGGQMNIAFEAEFYNTNVSETQFVVDSLGIKGINIDGDLGVFFPVSVYMKNLSYQDTIPIDPSFDFEGLVIDSSMIFINFKNGLPLSLSISAQLADNTYQTLCDIFDPAEITVVGSNVKPLAGTQYYVTDTATSTIVGIPVTKRVYDSLKQTKKLFISAKLNTSPTNNPARKPVAIRDSDKLDIRVWAKIKATLDLSQFDIISNFTKGGAK